MIDFYLVYAGPHGGTRKETVRSLAELKKRLYEIRQSYRMRGGIHGAVDLIRDDGTVDLDADPSLAERLSVGLGGREWIVCYFPRDPETHVLYSLGDRSALGQVVFDFGDYTPMSRKYLIPEHEALTVIEEWVENGNISTSIEWTDEYFPPAA